MCCDGCEVSCGSYLPTLSVRAAEVRVKSRRFGAATLGSVPLDLRACAGTDGEVPQQQELSDRGGVLEVGACLRPVLAALEEMSDWGALDSRDALEWDGKCPVHCLRQDHGPLAVATGVHHTFGANIEGAAVIPFPEIGVIPLLELSQHGRVVGEADLACSLLGRTFEFQLRPVVPVDLERRHQAPLGHIPPDHAGLRILLPVAAHRAETFDARRLSGAERPEHPIQVVTAPVPQAARAEVPIVPPV